MDSNRTWKRYSFPVSVIRRVKRIAEKELAYVYTGNLYAESNNTRCQFCNNMLITRILYEIKTDGLDEDGRCKTCGNYFHKKT
jgi:pyruvate formate lyase activating enzyme